MRIRRLKPTAFEVPKGVIDSQPAPLAAGAGEVLFQFGMRQSRQDHSDARPRRGTATAPGRLLVREARDFEDGADFDGAPARAGDAGGDLDGLVPVLRVDEEVAAELLARFGEGAVGDNLLAGAHADAGGRVGQVQADSAPMKWPLAARSRLSAADST